jgi:hypothetical protein
MLYITYNVSTFKGDMLCHLSQDQDTSELLEQWINNGLKANRCREQSKKKTAVCQRAGKFAIRIALSGIRKTVSRSRRTTDGRLRTAERQRTTRAAKRLQNCAANGCCCCCCGVSPKLRPTALETGNGHGKRKRTTTTLKTCNKQTRRSRIAEFLGDVRSSNVDQSFGQDL